MCKMHYHFPVELKCFFDIYIRDMDKLVSRKPYFMRCGIVVYLNVITLIYN